MRASIQVSGTVYVLGGFDADGAPTTTVYTLTPDPQTGDLGEWQTAPEVLALPEARAGAAGVAAPDGMLLIGGEGPDGPVATTWKSPFDDQGDAAEVGDAKPSLLTPRSTRPRRSSATTCGCTAGMTRTARRRPCSAATSGSRRPRDSPRIPTRARSWSGR